MLPSKMTCLTLTLGMASALTPGCALYDGWFSSEVQWLSQSQDAGADMSEDMTPGVTVDMARMDMSRVDMGRVDMGRMDMARIDMSMSDMAEDMKRMDLGQDLGPGDMPRDLNPGDMPQDIPQDMGPARVVQTAVGRTFSCARYSDGRVACWGGNARGELGRGTADTQLQTIPAVIPNLRAVSLSAGRSHSCAVTASGEVFCWGDNSKGQLGFKPDPADETRPNLLATPTKVNFPYSGARGLATQVSTRRGHACARMQSADVICWGDNDRGQLGANPVSGVMHLVNINDVVQVAVGGLHSCALQSTGVVQCWGYNFHGELGRASGQNYNPPAQTTGPAMRKIFLGEKHTCGITQDASQTLMCWGSYPKQQANPMNTYVAEPILGLDQPVDLASGEAHLCAVQADAKVLCWGRNLYNELGDRLVSPQDQNTPVALNRTGFKQISSKALHTCALDDQGGVFCWGNYVRIPTLVPGL